MSKADQATSHESSEVTSETRTSCHALHQYDGNEACQSRCTLEVGHDEPHCCGNGHDF